MVIELKKWQLVALGVTVTSWAVQTWGGWKLSKINDQLLERNKKLYDNGNRAAYSCMYLLVKIIEESDIELTEFDQQVLRNPPKLVDDDHPNLFAEFLEHWDGSDEDVAREFFMKLKQVREEDE